MGKFYTIEELNENARLSKQYALEAQLIRDTMNKKAKPAKPPKPFWNYSKDPASRKLQRTWGGKK